jgi:L-threonylcarbamoyladenylate synthase
VQRDLRHQAAPARQPADRAHRGRRAAAELGVPSRRLAAQLAAAFWPGPLTLVLPTEADLPWVTAGLDSIAVRQPRHEFALGLIRRAGPLARAQREPVELPSPTRACHAVQDLTGACR